MPPTSPTAPTDVPEQPDIQLPAEQVAQVPAAPGQLQDDDSDSDGSMPRLIPLQPVAWPPQTALVAAGWRYVAGFWWKPNTQDQSQPIWTRPLRQPPAPVPPPPGREPNRFHCCEHIAKLAKVD